MDQDINIMGYCNPRGYVAFSVPNKAEEFFIKQGESYWYIENQIKPVPPKVLLGTPVRSSTIRIESLPTGGFAYVDKPHQILGYLTTYNKRIFEVEIIGGYNINERGEGVATAVKVLEEITSEYLEEQKLMQKMHITYINRLYEMGIHLTVSGSTALFLYGARLKRWKNSGAGDLDVVVPFYINPKEMVDRKIYDVEGDDDNEYGSGNDYDFAFRLKENVRFGITTTKVDIRIDPKQRYEIIQYENRNYRVVPLETIIEAKARYAMERTGSWKKHRDDLKEMMLNDNTKIEKYVRPKNMGDAVPPPDEK